MNRQSSIQSSIVRHFLGWDAPATEKIVDFLLPGRIEAPPDLERSLIIVPTRQAGRRLREAMALRCSAAGVALLSARVETPAVFLHAEEGEGRVASPLQAAMAWTAVLMEIDPSAFGGLFPARPPDRDLSWALRTGEMLQELREALADGGLLIADVVRKFADLLEERDRWNDLLELEQRYVKCLAATGHEDPCSRKIHNALHPELPATIERIVVAAVPDPSGIMVSALEQTAARVQVEILVHAPDSLSHRFDAFGRPEPEYWKTAVIDVPLQAESIHLAASPEGQSRRVLSLIARHADEWGPADVAIGVPDRSVIPVLCAALEEKDLGTFDPAGRSPQDHPVFRLVRSLHAMVADDDYTSIATTLRHPDMLAFFRDQHGISPSGLMRELDKFQNEHLPSSFRDFTAHLHSAKHPELCRAMELVRNLAAPLSDSPHGLGAEPLPAPRPSNRRVSAGTGRRSAPAETESDDASGHGGQHYGSPEGDGLCDGLRKALRTIYDRRELRHGDPADDEFAAVAGLFDEAIFELGEAVARGGQVSGVQALDLMLKQLARQVYYTEREDAVIDLEGWLELPWNNAPLMIVTGMNDGFVPDSRVGDLFLPDPLRVALGLRSDESRLARDVYLMTSLIESRRALGRIHFIAGKTAQSGEPLKPSRLLFRCRDEELRERAQRLFGEAKQTRDTVPFTLSFKLNPGDFGQSPPVTRLSVTAFRSYLACPFRFYLQHVLGMAELDDGMTELDAMGFGSLIHYALQGMGEDEEAGRSDDEDRLRGLFCARAEAWVRGRFGDDPPLQILIQLDAARQRLAAAARRQADLVREGWETVAREARHEIQWNGMTISGIIDRVDRHAKDGRIRIIDYKSSDTATAPSKAHLGSADDSAQEFAAVDVDGKSLRWTDLQLPLYRLLLAADMDLSGAVEIGYFNLPKAVAETGLSLWDGYSPAVQASAERCAAGVIAAIRAQRFWPPAERVQYDDFESILFGDAKAAVGLTNDE